MKTIWKFPLQLKDGVQEIQVPDQLGAGIRAKTVFFGMQNGYPTLWIEVDSELPKQTKKFVIHGTGNEIGPGEKHIGTTFHGIFVWHLYEVP